MRRTFFEYLGVADLEKIHSQVLKWILSDNEGLSVNEKSTLIYSIFGIEDFEIDKIITEYDFIDIVILSKKNTIICIENKMKSSQTSFQLQKYSDKVLNTDRFSTQHFFFLTLVNEQAKDNRWKNITYAKILKVLTQIELKQNSFGIILREYISTLENFDKVMNLFLENPSKFPNVFLEASKSKKNKSKLSKAKTESQKFVLNNQLETIFQKLYFQEVAKKLKLNSDDFYIEETHGNVILGIFIGEEIELKGFKYRTGFDYQNGTFKTFLIAVDYKSSKKENLPKEIAKIFNSLINGYDYKRANQSRSKAYYSITKKSKDNIGISIVEFSNIYRKELDLAKSIINNELIPLFKEIS